MKCNKKILIPVIAVIVAAIVLGAYFLFIAKKPAVYAKNVTLVLNTGSGDVSISTGTNAAYVADLLIQLQTDGQLAYTAEEGIYGLYLTAINGRTVDAAHEYYALYIKGEDAADFVYASFGISQQTINNGDTVKIILETY